MSTLVEITTLASTRPAPGAPVSVEAAWYEHKAALLHRIADESPSEHDTYESLAEQAHEHAVRLLARLRG